MPDDEIARIEAEGISKPEVKDWPGARALFEQALRFEMPALRRAEILRNVAKTYFFEDDLKMANTTAQQALSILNSKWWAGARAGARANARAWPLRKNLYDIVEASGGTADIKSWSGQVTAGIAAWLTGSQLGAEVGLKVDGSLAWVDSRCAGALVGAVFGFFLLVRFFYFIPQFLVVFACAVGLFMTLVVLFSGNILCGSLTAMLLAIPVIFWLDMYFVITRR